MPAVTWGSLATTLGINVAIAFVVFTVFGILRKTNFAKKFYSPKRYISIPFRYRPHPLPDSLFFWWTPLLKYTDDEVYATAGLDALTYIHYLRLGLKLAIPIGFFCLAVLLPTHFFGGEVVQDCIDGVGEAFEKGECDKSSYTTFDKSSMANIKNQSNLFFVHVGVMWIVTFFVLSVLWAANMQAMKWRVRYLAESRKGGASHTVLVQNLPGIEYGTVAGKSGKVPTSSQLHSHANAASDKLKLKDGEDKETFDIYLSDNPHPPSSPPEMPDTAHANASLVDKCSLAYLKRAPVATDFDTWGQAAAALDQGIPLQEIVKREFERTYGREEVTHVTIIKDTAKLEGLAAKYNKAKQGMLDMIDGWVTKMRKGAKIKPATQRIFPAAMSPAGKERWGTAPSATVDKVEYMRWDLDAQLTEIKKEQDIAKGKDTCSAFVTFQHRTGQSQAASGLHYHNESYWTNEPAPGPEEVIWGNIKYRGWERTIRKIVAWGIFITMCLFFMIPVALVQSLMNVDKVDNWPGVSWLLDIVFFNSLIQGILPGLALIIFMALVPMFIKMINNVQGVYSASAMDFELGRKFYIFQVVIIWFGTLGLGTLLSSIEELREDPVEWLNGVGSKIPTTATFFISYILVQALIAKPISLLLRAPKLIIFLIIAKMTGSERARKRLWANQCYPYGTNVAFASMTFLYLFAYCTQQPLIVIPVVIYFVVMATIAKYGFMYVYREAYQSGGRMWPVMFEQAFTALMIMQVSMLVILGLKQFAFAWLMLFPLVVCIVFRRAVASTFERPLANLSLHAAADLDRADQNRNGLTDADLREMKQTMDCTFTPLATGAEMYKAPCFKISQEEHTSVLAELDAMHPTVKAYQEGVQPNNLPELSDEPSLDSHHKRGETLV